MALNVAAGTTDPGTMDDVLSDVLRLIRLESCVYFDHDFWSPWAMGLEAGPRAQFHVVLSGPCVIEAEEVILAVSPGDVVLFPRGRAHRIADAAGRQPVPGSRFMQSLETGAPLFAAGTAKTRLICGHYSYRQDVSHPLIQELPWLIHIPGFINFSPDSLASVLPMLIKEMEAETPGSALVVEKLAEVLLVQVLRAHFLRQEENRGFLAALFDGRLLRAIRMIHENFQRDLSLEELAAAAGMSRSAFALHFKQVLGDTPIAYLTRWRMWQAWGLLRAGDLSLAQVAERVGYESEVSFSRAFKRENGCSPGAVRRNVLQDRGTAQL